LHRKVPLIGLGRGINNQKEGNGIMVLIVGESYTAANGITEVIQGGNQRTNVLVVRQRPSAKPPAV
jgi:hypothetical protein